MSAHKQVYRPRHPRASASGMVYEHVLTAEAALGRFLPDGAEVHHLDENKRNNAKRNLVICQDHAYHALLHVRARVVRAGGNPNTHKFCSDCQRCRSFSAFNKSAANKSNGLQAVCRDCQHRRWVDRYAA